MNTKHTDSVEAVATRVTDEISHIVYEADGDKLQLIHNLISETLTTLQATQQPQTTDSVEATIQAISELGIYTGDEVEPIFDVVTKVDDNGNTVDFEDYLRTKLTTLQATQSQQVEEIKVEKFIDGIIAATQWLIDNGHLKAGSELNDMMLKALILNHQG